jgi:serine protease Do
VNNTLISILVLIAFCALTGCRPGDDSRQRELELRERELTLREREVALREAELARLKAQLDGNERSMSLAEIYLNVKKAVYLVSTSKEFGNSQGSAFVVHPSGIAVSNYHVFHNASDVIIYNENEEAYLVTEILEYNKEEDYILFKIGPNDGNLPYVELAEDIPAIGSECFTVGNPKGLTQTLSDGLISAYRENHRLLQTTTEITHGSSGGPLFDEFGKVVGITSSGYQKSDLNFAINIQSLPLATYLEKKRTGEDALSTYDILKLLANYYEHLEREDLDELAHTYNDGLSRYHNLFNINKYQAISDHIDYFNRYDVLKAEIIEHSVDIKFSGHEYYVSYQLDWSIERESDRQPFAYMLETVVEVDPNGCINSIYDNILNKKSP